MEHSKHLKGHQRSQQLGGDRRLHESENFGQCSPGCATCPPSLAWHIEASVIQRLSSTEYPSAVEQGNAARRREGGQTKARLMPFEGRLKKLRRRSWLRLPPGYVPTWVIQKKSTFFFYFASTVHAWLCFQSTKKRCLLFHTCVILMQGPC